MKSPKLSKVQIGAIAGVVVALTGLSVFAYTKLKAPAPAPTATDSRRERSRIADPVNVLPVAERPYLQISPLPDGRNLELIVKNVKKAADEVEYELEYQAGSLLQGAFGNLALSEGTQQAKILLGSCSAGGACTYHEDVKGGTLLTRFSGLDRYALKSDWRYIDNRARENQLSSKDAKFQLTSKELATQRFMVIFNTPGYPMDLPGTPVSDPYSLAVSANLKGTGSLTIRANEEGNLSVMGWDGQKWQEFSGTVEGKTITAEVPLLELYIAVKK
jgi:hypothetical protein